MFGRSNASGRRDFGDWRQCAFEGEKKNAVSARSAGKETAAGINGDVFIAFVFEDAGRGVHASAGLELPDALTVRGVQGGQAAIVATDKDKAAGGSYSPAVASVFPALLPNQAVGLHIQRGENPHCPDRHAAESATQISLTGLREFLIVLAAFEESGCVCGAHIVMVRVRIVGTGRPVDAAARAWLGYNSLCPEGRENAPLVDERETFRSDIDRLGHEGIAARNRLSGRRELPRLLRDGLFIYADQRLSIGAVQDVHPTGFIRFGSGFADMAADVHVEKHDGI